MPRDSRVDAYIAARAEFAQPILSWIRERVHAACPEVAESIKWSMPAFTYQGRPLAHMAAFKAHATFGFWYRDAMATGKEGEAMGQYGRIESGERPARAAKPPKPAAEVPADLAEGLAGDPEAAATFEGFPPGARREYCEWVAEAKRPETRAKRVAEAVEWLREGKRRNWRYESC